MYVCGTIQGTTQALFLYGPHPGLKALGRDAPPSVGIVFQRFDDVAGRI